MFDIGDDAVMVGATEFRSSIPKFAKKNGNKTVFVTSRGEPVAVLEPFSKNKKKEKLIDDLEDLILGHLAKERYESSSSDDFLAFVA
jgi:hypothetical protein